MDAGKQLAAEILDAIKSGRDLWVLDQFIEGYDRLERAKFSSGQNGLSFHWLPCWKRRRVMSDNQQTSNFSQKHYSLMVRKL